MSERNLRNELARNLVRAYMACRCVGLGAGGGGGGGAGREEEGEVCAVVRGRSRWDDCVRGWLGRCVFRHLYVWTCWHPC